MPLEIQKLKDQRNEVAASMRSLVDTAEGEDRGFSAEEESQWNSMLENLDAFDARITRAESLEARTAPEPEQRQFSRAERSDPENHEQAVEGMDVFRSWARSGMEGLSAEERAYMAERRSNAKEIRAFSAGTGNTGGFTVPEDFLNQLEIAMKRFGGMLEVADVMRTDTGADLPMPTFNYTGVSATIVGENAAGSMDSSTPFGVVTLGSYTYRSPILPVSYEFLQDSSFGEGFLSDALGETLGRGINAHATTGTGTGQPNGIVTASAVGKTGATGQTGSIIYDDLVDLEHAVDPAYRNGARFMFHDDTLKILRKLKDADGRPLWQPDLGAGIAASLNGKGYQVNQDMPTMAANAKSVLFGALNKYKLRIVRDVTMLRLTERYADNLQVAFLAFMRADGDLLDAGTNPVAHYANSAT